MRFLLPLFLFSVIAPAAVRGISPEEEEFFETKIRPVLAEQCYKCHGPEKQKADLRMDSREAVLKGTDEGPIVVPGKPDESSLIKSIRHIGESKMPAKADKLPDAQIQAVAQWVSMGLPWPAETGVKLTSQQQAAKTHWAFQPVKKPEVPPAPAGSPWAKSELDYFILAKLQKAKLEPSPPATKAALLRRATFDLTGLPPAAEEVAAFEKDASPDAFAKVVDRLLASPHYGERWGRHWLDVARYADTKGYVFQEERNFGFAYTYRDWVIKALNDDLPYDQFLIKQIAADHQVTGGDVRPLAAMGFLTLGRQFLNNQQEIIDDRIDVLARGTMGLTVACARCHDHKFDPISQKDYYALYGVFASSIVPKELPKLPSDAAEDAGYREELSKLKAELEGLLGTRSAAISVVASLATRMPILVPLLSREPLKELLSTEDRERSKALSVKVDTLNAGPLSPPRAMALVDGPVVEPVVFKRGNPGSPGDRVPRRFLSVLSKGEPQPFTKGSGRLELAQAIASKENPLTARVFVNRVWTQHFGKGLVRSPGDFGVRGDAPTHPELLDWLATRFVEDGWSMKKLHRLIMLSATYQQGSDEIPKAVLADPENLLVWRMNRRRLDFEALRDSLLSVAGQLDQKMGGRSDEITKEPFTKRRTVYSFIDRQNLPGVFRTFDFASPDTTNAQRYVTTVPQQALFMMNSPFVVEQARALVAKPAFQQPQAYEEQVQELYTRVFARRAANSEVDLGLRYVTDQITQPADLSDDRAWQYGFGSYDEALKKVTFQPLPAFANGAWQGGPKLPDPALGWVSLNAAGGHPGNDQAHCAIRRWVAPQDGVVSIHGALQRPAGDGDGVLVRIVSDRSGELLKAEAGPQGNAPTNLAGIAVKQGEKLDFIVDPRGNVTSDSFQWTPQIQSENGGWDSREQFAGPREKTVLTPWEKYAQVLLETNEFVFID